MEQETAINDAPVLAGRDFTFITLKSVGLRSERRSQPILLQLNMAARRLTLGICKRDA